MPAGVMVMRLTFKPAVGVRWRLDLRFHIVVRHFSTCGENLQRSAVCVV